MITLHLAGEHPLLIPCETLEGFRRPLNGASASLTVTAQQDAFFADWLANPPLGLACTVAYDDEVVMEGTLYGVRVSEKAVELRVEG